MTFNSQIFIIAEAGVNHNGSLSTAFELVDTAVAVGADAIKFQTFITDNLVTDTVELAPYQKRNLNKKQSQKELLSSLQLSFEDFRRLFLYTKKKNIIFLSTPFDEESLDFLVEELGIKTIKISSGEITNGPFLYKCALKEVDIILSTGMSTISEITDALSVIAAGYLGQVINKLSEMKEMLNDANILNILQQKVTLLHCTTEYPAKLSDVNLNAIATMEKTFSLSVGYSDHTMGVAVPVAASALGARVIEKHLTLDREQQGPDHKSSLEPQEFRYMVESIRNIEEAMGSPEKMPCQIELANRDIVRKSLVAKASISEGSVFTGENITTKRPGTGISPMLYWDYLGKASDRAYQPNEHIDQVISHENIDTRQGE